MFLRVPAGLALLTRKCHNNISVTCVPAHNTCNHAASCDTDDWEWYSFDSDFALSVLVLVRGLRIEDQQVV